MPVHPHRQHHIRLGYVCSDSHHFHCVFSICCWLSLSLIGLRRVHFLVCELSALYSLRSLKPAQPICDQANRIRLLLGRGARFLSLRFPNNCSGSLSFLARTTSLRSGSKPGRVRSVLASFKILGCGDHSKCRFLRLCESEFAPLRMLWPSCEDRF